jgi:hypothetical protein
MDLLIANDSVRGIRDAYVYVCVYEYVRTLSK